MKKLLAILSSVLLLSTSAFAAGEASGSAMSSILMLVAFFAIFYFLLIRPQMKRNKEQRKMLSEIAKGDEVMTTGGIVGKIVKVGENYTELEISDNVIVKIQKSAVSGVLPKGAVQTN
ncbi:preprotein translocase subunit YajC [Fangia hongkongensis]|uniref:preprotein translocase subunit YajC n=1 Tax=Fangia hongkongensis TaxID=270495 RepID=UPI0003621648|nr:preprotein translocase subunit YajC [Fangia hongkongensis]MBK2123920.1 preprotein translocase subunit YajC [Fangia hongkongensis]